MNNNVGDLHISDIIVLIAQPGSPSKSSLKIPAFLKYRDNKPFARSSKIPMRRGMKIAKK